MPPECRGGAQARFGHHVEELDQRGSFARRNEPGDAFVVMKDDVDSPAGRTGAGHHRLVDRRVRELDLSTERDIGERCGHGVAERIRWEVFDSRGPQPGHAPVSRMTTAGWFPVFSRTSALATPARLCDTADMSLAMTQSEREAFLAGMHVGVLSVVEADGKPIGVPVWYTYEPGGDISVHIDPGSRKGKALTATGRFSLCAQSEELPYKYVLVTGRVRESRAPSEVERRELAYRYLGPEFGESYLEATRDEAAGILLFVLQPDQWMTVDYGKQFGG